MDGVKKWYASRGVLGSLATMALGLASTFGLIGESDAQAIQSQASDLLVGLGTLVAGAVSLWGRIAASRKLDL